MMTGHATRYCIASFLALAPAKSRAIAVESAPPGRCDEQNASDFSEWVHRPKEPFSNGSAMFDLVKRTLLEKYITSGLTEDDLYRAAVKGLLAHSDPEHGGWNDLLAPTEYAELIADTKGEVVGVGVEVAFKKETGRIDVVGVIPGTAAARAGLVRGDQILKIDGKGFQGSQFRDVIYAIRGIGGTSVSLTLLHEDAIRTVALKREALTWETVESQTLGDGLALVTIHYFTASTPTLLRKTLTALSKNGLKGLIVDLRGNEGGVFESALRGMELLIPKSAPMIIQQLRGSKAITIVNHEDPVVKGVPLAVLINTGTKSGAEMMAAALSESASAATIGTRTFGKWNAQRVDELPNHYAIKYTTATYRSPRGGDFNTKGLSPDIAVDMPAQEVEKLQREPDVAVRVRDDLQLATAINVLKLRRAPPP